MSYQLQPPSPEQVIPIVIAVALPLVALALVGGIGYGVGEVVTEKLLKQIDEKQAQLKSVSETT